MKKLSSLRLYAITDRLQSKSKDLIEICEALAAGGADVIQLREKALSDRELVEVASKIKKAIKRYNSLFILNDRIDIASCADADGVHLGQDDLPLNVARKLFYKKKIVGISTHSRIQAIAAQRAGADYIGVGPIFSTPTKPDYEAVGLGLISKVNIFLKIPFVAIGGVNIHNLEDVVKSGATRVAVVRALMNSNDICKTTRLFKKHLISLVNKHSQ